MEDKVNINLTHDEALVLFDWLVRFNAQSTHQFENQAEQRVLWNIEADLESAFVAPLSSDYAALLDHARARVRDVVSER